MAAPLPPWSDTVLRVVMIAAAALVLGAPSLCMGFVRTPAHLGMYQAPSQPVMFDHRHHVRDDGIDCRYCHYDAERSPHAGVPGAGLCMSCHAQIWNDSPLLEPVRRSAYGGEPLEWQRVHVLPDFVFFNHAAHVTRGVGCEYCHGRVDGMARVAQVQPLDMDWCLHCHRDPAPHLRPPRLATVMGYETSRREGERIARELDIAPPTDCTGCHR
ncbi:MAG: cytochrome c3 family protein [Myxococcota bacterium]